MPTTTFTRKQRVVVVEHTGYLVHDESRIVERVGERCVTLDDGTQWTLDGRPFKTIDRGYLAQRIRPVTDADAVEFTRRRDADVLSRVTWRDMPDDVIAACRGAVDKYRASLGRTEAR